PVPIEARWFVLIYGAFELLFGVTGTMPGVAHFAHLGGMLFGAILLYRWGWRPGMTWRR
ncbi:MAG: rhomboid family intramembrane serine protease, partial [Xanthomonadales bacterium]|nr:rhomboid family intramembrane serine protease [Xanthomonadales bacterium]